MAEVPQRGEAPKIMSLYFPGGGMMGMLPLAVLARIEELTGKPPAELFQSMEGGSVASFLIAGMNRRKSDDSASSDYNKPYYTMKEGLKLFIEETPKVFPHVDQRLGKMFVGQLIDTQKEIFLSSPKNPIDCKNTEGLMRSLCNGFNVAAVNVVHPLGAAFWTSAFATPANYIRENWANDYMYDPKKLEDLYKRVLGEDTRMSDSLGTMNLPSYNMGKGHVEFFSVEKRDMLDTASANAVVSHGNPRMWEVAMAAAANNLALKPYTLNDQVYFDGAMFHQPTKHKEISERKGAPEVVLVNIMVIPEDQKSMGEILKTSTVFPKVVDAISLDLKASATADDRKRLTDVFGNAVKGFTQGGLVHVHNYLEDMKRMNDGRTFPKDHVVTIAPPPLKPNEDPKIKPNILLEAFSTTPESMAKIAEYSKRTLEGQDLQIRLLAIELLANQVRMGRMTPEDYFTVTKKIESQTFENSEIPAFLDSLVKDTPKAEVKKVSSLDQASEVSVGIMAGAKA